MTTQVLYRKWRPQRFADVVGQDAVTQTLSQAVAHGRLAHAYLFSGPRGTGKTSTARVLAKAVNCLGRIEGTGDPDGTCNICVAIEQASFVDLIEVDAASNRGIDEIRDLRDKVHFAPGQGVYKVYIIDEVHMLTDAAFNAFLKTLEEPPPHAIFILATTEPHRLPATIISRCQRFDFRRISIADVVGRLAQICEAEGVEAPPEVLRSVARAAGGSLRDATNLLDQLVTSYGNKLEPGAVRSLLGMAGEDRAVTLVKHLLSGNTAQALTLINALASEGLDLRPLHRMTVDFLRAVLLMKTGVKDPMDLAKEVSQELSFMAQSVSLERVLRALKLFGQVSLKYDQPSPLPLELATVELNLEPEAPAAPPVQPPRIADAPPQRQAPSGAPSQYAPPRQPTRESRPTQQPTPATANASNSANSRTQDHRPTTDPALTEHWPGIVRSMTKVKGKRFDIGALLRSSNARYLDGDTLVVQFSHRSNSERLQDELEEPRGRQALEEALQQALGAPYTVRVETTEDGLRGLSTPATSHLVQTAINMGGKVVVDTSPEAVVEPVSEEVIASVSPETVVEPASEEAIASASLKAAVEPASEEAIASASLEAAVEPTSEEAEQQESDTNE
jgi:DNA polymerase-3 subunit gamma/tau